MNATRNPDELRESYKWLRDRLKAELPGYKIIGTEFDFGSGYGIGVSRGDGESLRRHAVRVEYDYTTGHDPDGYLGKAWAHYSLNEDPAKEERVAEIIKAFRAL